MTMACDVCFRSGETRDINSMLSTKYIQTICPSCAKKCDVLLTKFRHMAWVRAKRKLIAMRKSNNPYEYSSTEVKKNG